MMYDVASRKAAKNKIQKAQEFSLAPLRLLCHFA
jgi:hypothetical protein